MLPKWKNWLAAAALVLAASPAAAGTLEDIRARGRLIVGVKADYAPLGFIDDQGRNAGVEIELARFIAAQLLGDPGRVEFVPVVFKNRVDYLLAGKIDMILATMVPTPERLKIVEDAIRRLLPGWSLASVVTAIQSMRGVALLPAVTLVAEIGDFSRFTSRGS